MTALQVNVSQFAPSSEVVVRAVIDRIRVPGVETRRAASKVVASLVVRTDARGAVVIY
ncbi:hypothetical protein [Gemmatimonas sp.]|uniref:hypothetical protein n=1 Tax=Gemmatimonas sp. TaxID=1962908 RepID=UPI0035680F1F